MKNIYFFQNPQTKHSFDFFIDGDTTFITKTDSNKKMNLISHEQYRSEQYKEQQFNALFDAVAKKSPFGQWYGYMMSASSMMTDNLPKRIAIDDNGRPIVIYKGGVGKLLGVWSTPTHESVTKKLSTGDWLGALASIFGGGHIQDIQTQTKKYNQTFDISPDEISQLWAEKIKKEVSPETANVITQLQQEAEIKIEAGKIGSKNSKTTKPVKSEKLQKTKKKKFNLFSLLRKFGF